MQPRTNKSHYYQKRSKELSDLIKICKYIDAFMAIHQVTDFTWNRQGSRPSRLDRAYVPPHLASDVRDCQHHVHLSDHKAISITFKNFGMALLSNIGPPKPDSYWKLNSRVLEDPDYEINFNSWLSEILSSKPNHDSLVDWFDSQFKNKFKSYLIYFSTMRQISRRATRDLISHYLQEAHSSQDWEMVSYCRSRIRRMNLEDSMGLIIRSRNKETLELEKLSLFHLNREVKKGGRGVVSKLSKVIGNRKVIIDNRDEIKTMTEDFFSQLFQGHHRANGTIEDAPFEPNFTHLPEFIEGVGKLSDEESKAMIKEVTVEEVLEVITEGSSNKSPGIDGLTYEFYKRIF